ncbi:hypothetical protein [Jannaschia aquimarina]|uniref:Uncharacterized protein n=1 Tax=Jannaschia aquimarina TaxID=935700 RepID=A0A0D1EJV1_9RHOB|nr:hypothetical protein [Jannaschia aquimarina]KIT16085.1 hypothetical protein jaqu_23570 [Jannaschia aquimarina]SNT02012.1 hypothetical protein SAMN05421775_104268 [Jannaschia aquimarina]
MRPRLAWVIACAGGLAAAYAVARASAELTLSGAPTRGVLLAALGTPIAGVAAFAFLYGIVVGRALDSRFWAFAIAIVTGIAVLFYVVITQGLATPIEAAAVSAILACGAAAILPVRA